MMHAEMCAVTEAARIGIPVRDATLYGTVFPCHNCAKHIVGVGLKQVVYLQPYPKSYVSELYPDSIEIDPSDAPPAGKIAFRQFVGVSPARYYLFSKERLKDDTGKIKKWEKATANPTSRQVIPQQTDVEKFALHSLRQALETIRSLEAEQGASASDSTKKQ
jgi:hypothetical protein